jgi:energy-coupling factor transport system ATP-binding protein
MLVAKVQNLCFAYKSGQTVLSDISFSISAGEVFVIAGLSGSGKTTLCQLLSGIIPHAIKGELEGEIWVSGINPSQTGLAQTAQQAGLVFQDADSQIICTTVEDELAFGLENLCWPPLKIRSRVEELLQQFDLTALREKNPALLSGGQKKLLTIAAVIAPAPPLLILDEPFSGLDAAGRALVRAAIEEQSSGGRAVIVVEHVIKLVTFADKWLLLHNGSIAVCDTPPNIMQQKNLLKELYLLP